VIDSEDIDLPGLRPALERAFQFATGQVRAIIMRTPDYFPIYTEHGRWKHGGELWTDWCAGFLTGMLWIIARRTGDAWWRSKAEHYSMLLEHKKHDRNVHDLGFIFLNSFLPWYEQTGDARLQEVLVTAGRTLAMRFNPKGSYLRSFVAPESLFIDIMMNVPLIFYAARATGDQALYDLAVAHCRTTECTLIRPDGGTAHEGIFDLNSGAFLSHSTHQGLRADSDWTRGLVWSLHGFTTVYGYTKDRADLAVAVRNADHFLARCPMGTVPPWDFDVPDGPDRLHDSSAAAIGASGMLDLAAAVDDQARSRQYRTASLNLLQALSAPPFLAAGDPDWEGVLKHAVYHFPKRLGVDESVMWGDFFFLLALDKALN
jgi:unsaturated chondroitin disaccharide hydrolase